MTRKPEEGGICNGGPFNGRILAFNKLVMPIFDPTGKRIGTCIWDDDHWEYEDDNESLEIYPN